MPNHPFIFTDLMGDQDNAYTKCENINQIYQYL